MRVQTGAGCVAGIRFYYLETLTGIMLSTIGMFANFVSLKRIVSRFAKNLSKISVHNYRMYETSSNSIMIYIIEVL